ncbi:transcription factor TFIIIB component B'' homolog [Bombina bombina]|uniref:transcription factor TFIIIB component B'' homolog n=1 Tax=Bombina bombina TaxID=8345 RepID=UPI00235AF618|nr:transcription factor TFIIIB component B'' homolog [Bombina bombina]
MIRRARLSFKPNVRPGGRGPSLSGTGAEREAIGGGAPENEESKKGSTTAIEIITNSPAVELSTGQESGESQSLESTGLQEKTLSVSTEDKPSLTTHTPLQRRKRISTLPNLAKPRVSNSSVSNASQKDSKVEVHPPPPPPIVNASLQKNDAAESEKKTLQSTVKSSTPKDPSQGLHHSLPEKRTPVPQIPQYSPFKKPVFKYPETTPSKTAESLRKDEQCPLKEIPSQESCINEKYLGITQTTPVKKKVYNLERERLRRAQKLRELLKDELRKEKKAWKEKHPVISTKVDLERSKMVMRDFVHFIPSSNPMSSPIEEKKTNEKSPGESQNSVSEQKNTPNEDEDFPDEEDNNSQLVVPRVKVAEDGTIILDEESLTVEVIRTKAAVVENDDPIFERGSMTTYSSFRKHNYSKPWSSPETEMFFLAISMVGTDFSMIGQLFPHRGRLEIKNKFKREERANGWRIDKAFREKKKFDIEIFAELLQKALAEVKKKRSRPIKKTNEKKTTKPRKKQKGKQTDEQENLDDPDAIGLSEADAMTAEKENEQSLDATESPDVSGCAPVKKRVRKKKDSKVKEVDQLECPSGEPKIAKKKRKSKKKDKHTEQKNIDADGGTADKENEMSLSAPGSSEASDSAPVKKKRARKKKDRNKEPEEDQIEIQPKKKEKKSSRKRKESSPNNPSTANAFEQDLENDEVLCAEEPSSPKMNPKKKRKTKKKKLNTIESEEEEHVDMSPVPKKKSKLKTNEIVNVSADALEDHMEYDDDVFENAESSTCGQMEEPICGSEVTLVNTGSSSATDELNSIQEKILNTEAPDSDHMSDGPLADQLKSEGESYDNNNVEVQNIKYQDSEDATSSTVQIPPQAHDSCAEHSESAPLLHAETSSLQGDIEKETTITEPVIEVKSFPSIRGRLLRPKPNLAKVVGNRKAPAHEQPTEIDQPTVNSQEIDGKLLSPNVPHDRETPLGHASEEENKSQVSCDSKGECKKSPIKPAVLARNRLLRPKPNLTRTPARADKLEANKDLKEVTNMAEDGHSSEIHQKNTSLLEKSIEQENEVSLQDENCQQVNICSVPPTPTSTSCSAGGSDTGNTDAGYLEQSDTTMEISANEAPTSQEQSPIKPAPLKRGRFQRPKPNLMKASSRTGNPVARDDIKEHEEQDMQICQEVNCTQDSSLESYPQNICSEPPVAEQPCNEKNNTCLGDLKEEGHTTQSSLATEENQDSQENNKSEALKPALLKRGRLQRPKPNIARASVKRDGLVPCEATREEISGFEIKDSKLHEDASSNTLKCNGNNASPINTVKENSLSSCISITLKDVKQGSSSPELSLPNIELDNDDVSASSLVEPPVENTTQTSVVMAEENDSQEDKKSSLKPALLKRGRFQKPKPNIVRASVKRDGLVPSEATKEVMSESEHFKNEDKNTSGAINRDNESSTVLQCTKEEFHSPELSSRTPGQVNDDDSSSSLIESSVDNSTPTSIKEEMSSQENESSESLKPAVFQRGRFQKPKPNIGRVATRKTVHSSLDAAKNEACKDGKEQESDHITVATQMEHTNLDILNKPQEHLKIADVKPITDVPISPLLPSVDLTPTPVEQNDQPFLSKSVIENFEETASPSSPQQLTPSGRLQRPKPNLIRANGRKATSSPTGTTSDLKVLKDSQTLSISVNEDMSADACKPVNSPKTCSTETIENIISTGEVSEPAASNEESNVSTIIKPAQLRRGRLVRPKPNLVKAASSRRETQVEDKLTTQSDTVKVVLNESLRQPVSPSPITQRFDERRSIEVPGSPSVTKRKSDDECNWEASPRRSHASNTEQKSPCLSVHELDSSSGISVVNTDSTRTPQRSRFGRQLNKPLQEPKAAEHLPDPPEKEKPLRNVKTSKAKVIKPLVKKGRTTLVKLRASEREEEEDDETEEVFEEESYNLSPDKVNQAPVFVPFSLRSPKPVPAEIEETVEELEIPVEVLDVQTQMEYGHQDSTESYLSCNAEISPAVPANADCSDGSAEAAMTLISMGHPVVQPRSAVKGSSECATNSLAFNIEGPSGQKQLMINHSPTYARSSNEELASEETTEIGEFNIEGKSTSPSRSVENGHHPLGLQTGSRCLAKSEEEEPGIFVLECLPSHTSHQGLPVQNTAPITTNCSEPFSQCKSTSEQGDSQQDCTEALKDDISVDCPPEEATFILTLVEIPINPEYPYSCDSLSAEEPLPAPVLISPVSSEEVTQDQSTEPASAAVPDSESCSTICVEEDSVWSLSQISRTRNSSGSDEIPPTPCKKPSEDDNIMVCKEDDDATEKRAEEGNVYSLQEVSLGEILPETEKETSQDLFQNQDFPEGERNNCGSLDESDKLLKTPEGVYSKRQDWKSFSKTSTPSTSTASPSKAALKRPGRKLLGFLPLVCKDKKPKKVLNKKKKNARKPNCKLPSKTKKSIQDPSQDTSDKQVPSVSADSSSAIKEALLHEVSNNQEVEIKEESILGDVASEEEETTVSEYFFSDIFMEVDD